MKERSYQEKLRKQLGQWQERIDGLREQMKHAGGESRHQAENRIQDLEAKQKAARHKLDQLARLNRAGEKVRRGSRNRIAGARKKVGNAIRRLVSGPG